MSWSGDRNGHVGAVTEVIAMITAPQKAVPGVAALVSLSFQSPLTAKSLVI